MAKLEDTISRFFGGNDGIFGNRLLIIDGNSIMNRAFYGIMSSKSLMSADGKYTNAVYGFLSILFKDLEDLKSQITKHIIGKKLILCKYCDKTKMIWNLT